MSVAHPCPVDAPWLAQVGHGDHATQTSHGHSDAPANSSSCHCVGACQSGAATLVSISTGPAAILATVGWNTSPASPNSDTPAQPRLRRHPSATAPPLA